MNVREFYSLFKPSGEELPVVCNSDGLTVEIELAPTQCLAFVAKKTKTQRKKEITQTVRFDLFPKSVYTELLNTFAIDRVTVTVDGERKPLEYFGKLQFVQYAKTLEVEYGFTMEDLSPEIYILCESSHCVQVFVNGVPIKECCLYI